MTATRTFIPIRACCTPVTLSSTQNFFNAFQARDNFLSKRRQDNVASSSTLDLDRRGLCHHRRREKINDGFVVNLEVTASEKVFPGWCSFDESEDVAHCTWDDTRLLLVSGQCECLARGGLSVGEDDGVVPVHCGLYV